MAPRQKKLVALLALLPGIALYLFAAAALGERVPDVTILKVLYYLAAGVLWAFPARYLLKWADAESSRNDTTAGPS
jgi:hypothetical protein